MESDRFDRFDRLARAVSALVTRRTLAGMLALASLPVSGVAGAKTKKKRRQKATFNDFGCVNVGDLCKTDGQCCSGMCKHNTCRAHDASNCRPGQNVAFCGGAEAECTASNGDPDGKCQTTTGQAEYCGAIGKCFTCKKDADCIPECGPHAACIVCTGCPLTNGTACPGRRFGDCRF